MPSAKTGFLYALVAFTIFAAQDGISKHLGSAYPPVFVAMLRYWAFAVFVLLMAAKSSGGIRGAAIANRPWLQISRGVLLAVQI
ncbi:MAG TPA: EamA family transporter, partial [Agrobacterium sp.]|nr:EamA family transporter [Agrobacterium sp.]